MSIFDSKKTITASKVILPQGPAAIPMTTVVYDCPYCGDGFVSPLIGLPPEKVIGSTLPLKCGSCMREFMLEVKYDTPQETQ